MGIKITNKTKTSNDSSYRKVRSLISFRFRAVGIALGVFSLSFFVSLISASNFMPVDKGDAVNGTYYTNITSSGNIGINVISTPDGSIEVGKDSLSINTNATNGYKLYISTVSGASGNGLYGSGGGAGSFISPSSGSSSSPVALSTNTWGYVASRDSNNGSSIVNNATSTTGNILGVSNELSGSGSGSSSLVDGITTYTKDSAIFAAVPTYGNEDILYANDNPSASSYNSVDVYYGVNATTALPSGTYTNSVVYTAITDASNSQSDGITISPTSQSSLNAGTSVTISTSIYPSDNVNINDLGITVTIGSNSCTNITPSLGSGGNLEIACSTPSQSTDGSYNVNVKIDKYDSSRTYTLANGYEYNTPSMQDFVCSTLASVGDTMDLRDSRDNKHYTVAKLADGKCWMTKNLEIAGRTIYNTDSNITASSYSVPSSSTSGFSDSSAQNVYIDSTYGGYYTWPAVTAGTNPSSGNATSDICPKNWRLPTQAEFNALTSTYSASSSGSKLTQSPINMLYGGYYYSSSPNGQGSLGYYWSSSAYNSALAYNLYFNSSSANTDYSNKRYGYSVRCIAEPPMRGTMQDFASCSAMATGESYSLTDNRDQQVYTVAKLADEKCWMTSDLKLGNATLTLDDSNSNIPSGSSFTLGDENTGTWCTSNDNTCYQTKNWIKTGVPNGYLYNWYTATAGTTGYNSNNPTADICPKNWQLPSGGASGDFVNLVKAYGGSGSNTIDATTGDKLLASPVSMNYTGYRDGGSTGYTTTRAYYWSRTVNDIFYAYYLNFDSSGGLNPRSSNFKNRGYAIRCLVK